MKKQIEAISKTEALELVKDSISSIFTKDDVLELINRIDEDNTDVETYDLKDFLSDYLSDNLDSSCVDTDSAEFELDGDRITLVNVELDTYSIESVVKDAVDAYKQK